VLGANLGGNAILIGDNAKVVVAAGIAARSDTPITFWQFTRNGLVVATATIAVSSGYVWLRYFVLAG
jgi:Na+/H+ antiporter NhaD/arsenite permease-like protein